MTRGEKIRKATLEFVSAMCQYCSVKEKCKDTKGYCTEYDSQECGFVAGAEWADEHPKNIWHDASEEPQGEYEIMCQDEFEGVWLTCYRKDIENYKNGWEECVAGDCIVRWAYIDDILPKGGEK